MAFRKKKICGQFKENWKKKKSRYVIVSRMTDVGFFYIKGKVIILFPNIILHGKQDWCA